MGGGVGRKEQEEKENEGEGERNQKKKNLVQSKRTNKRCVSKPIYARGGRVGGGSTFNDNIHNCYKHHLKRHTDTRGCETGL